MNIAIKNLQTKFSIPNSKITPTIKQACKSLRLTKYKEISIVFVGARRMQSINKKYLGHDYVTDVITFDLQEAAEIIICPMVAFKNARDYGQSLTKEILLYVIHGILHLAGYDDHAPRDRDVMRLKEQQLLGQIL